MLLEDDIIIDLNELSNCSKINNSDIILSILEICTFNKRYNYECSNNTKSFWDRVVQEEVLKKIFKNFKPETLRKYWKLIREAGDINKYIETIRTYSKIINNPKYKLLQIINCISSFIKSGEEDFKKYFSIFDPKQKIETKNYSDTNNNDSTTEQNYKNEEIFHKIKDEQETIEDNSKDIEPKILLLDNIINELMKITKFGREEVFNALYGTNNNIENAFLYLTNKEMNEKLFFRPVDDLIIKNDNPKDALEKLIEEKGEKLVNERKQFLKIQCP